jgi:hypothetical protein
MAIAFGALALAVAPVRAQTASSGDVAVVPAAAATAPVAEAAPAPVAGPSVEAARVGVRRDAPAAAPAQPMAGTRDQGIKLMIFGGAAILTGIVVGNNAGYAISIGGAVIGLIGLYQYLQ